MKERVKIPVILIYMPISDKTLCRMLVNMEGRPMYSCHYWSPSDLYFAGRLTEARFKMFTGIRGLFKYECKWLHNFPHIYATTK